ncbi:MAG: DUF2147 domain-containing protein [Treponema sp.]|nr:DUF2147 domain-containing protein [Treponema sp.]
MKRFLTFAAALLAAAYVFAADPAEGYWVSYDDKTNEITAAWNFYVNSKGEMEARIVYSPQCDDTAVAERCSNLKGVKNFPVAGDLSKMKVLHETPWIFGLKKTSHGVWDGGNIIDCGEGKIYNCKVTFTPADGKKFKKDTLVMRGSIGPLGRNQFWLRPDSQVMESINKNKR